MRTLNELNITVNRLMAIPYIVSGLVWCACGAVLASTFLTSCTDARWGKFQSLGNSATVECYSGGKLIYKGKSTGKVVSEEGSDGYYFKDASDGKTKEVSGDCIISYEK